MLKKKVMFKSCFKIILVAVVFCGCKKTSEKVDLVLKPKESSSKVAWGKGQKYYVNQIEEALKWLDTLQEVGFLQKETKLTFFKVRAAFKKAEPYAGYLSPETAHKTNGPALPIYKEDSGKVVKPVGFQKLEETIYDDSANQDDFYHEIKTLKGLLTNLKGMMEQRNLTAKRFFIATHQQLMRLVSLSTVGFDTPVSGESIKEIAVSLESLKSIYKLTIGDLILDKNEKINTSFNKNIDKAVSFINNNSDFETFDRFTFIRDYLNPVVRNWVSIRKESELWDGKTNAHIYNFDAPTFF